jgi:predicted alpha/beta-hydrolase family hydrolase
MERVGSEHFPDVRVCSRFLRDTRDRLCESQLLACAMRTLGAPEKRVDLDDADHSFDVLVRSGRTRAQVLARLVDEAAAWMLELP